MVDRFVTYSEVFNGMARLGEANAWRYTRGEITVESSRNDKGFAAREMWWRWNVAFGSVYGVSLNTIMHCMYIYTSMNYVENITHVDAEYIYNPTGKRYKVSLKFMGGYYDTEHLKRLAAIEIAKKMIEKRNEEEKKNMNTIDSRKILNDVAATSNNRHVLKDYYASFGLEDECCQYNVGRDYPVSRSLFMGVDITDVKVYNDRAVLVYFSDGSFTKSECQKDEVFNLDTGIAICLCKKLLSKGGQDGHKVFNDLIRKAHKVMKKNELDKAREEVRKAEEKKRNAKAIERSKRRKERAAARQTEIQKQAYLQAMHELDSEKKAKKVTK